MSSTSLSTYLGYRIYAGNLPKSLQRVASESAVTNAKRYYDANIGKVTSVDGFLGNYKLFSYAMKASGLEDMTYAKAFMRKVLTSDLSDASSFVNKLTDTRFKAFAQQFQFASASTAAAQTSEQEDRTVALYTAKTGSSSIGGVLATAYYEDNIGKVKSVQDLTSDPQLLDYVMTAYGLDATTLDKGSYAASTQAASDLVKVLESDPSDTASVASGMAAGAIDASNIPLAVQSSTQQAGLSSVYTAAYGRTTDLIYYENTIGSVHSLDAFLADPKLVTVAESAYGLDPNTYSTTDLKHILTSNLDDPMSVANQLGAGAVGLAKAFNFASSASTTSPYLAIARDFNFGADGKAATARVAQSTLGIAATEVLYKAQSKSDAASQSAATTESTYYTTAMTSVRTLGDFLADSRLVSYVTRAYGLPATTSAATLGKILTSDLTDPKSTASQMGASARKVAAAFNFSTAGTITRATTGAQSAKAAQVMDDSYLQQTLEDEAGDDNEGIKLALYFRRKVASGAVTSAYGVLADPALLKVVQTALRIPSSSSKQDIDIQAKQITSRLTLSDLQNPKKLDSFISRFAALYDLNQSTSSSDTIATLFG